jgi:hypothetical protein
MQEHTLCVENDTVVCGRCGFRVRINEYYDLVDIKGQGCPADIDQWYKWQRRCVASRVTADDFEMSLSCSLCTLKFDKLRTPPKNRRTLSVGTARLTNRGLLFSGMLDGQTAEFEFDAKSLYSLTFSTEGFLEFYYNSEYFMLVPDETNHPLIKWTLAAEEIHNLCDEKWRSACADVYGIEEKIYE